MLVYSALNNANRFDLKNLVVNVEININSRSIDH